jgi:hypothetical protein
MIYLFSKILFFIFKAFNHDSSKLSARFIDLGQTEIVPLNNIHQLPNQFSCEPAFLVHVFYIIYVQLMSINNQCENQMIKYMMNFKDLCLMILVVKHVQNKISFVMILKSMYLLSDYCFEEYRAS